MTVTSDLVRPLRLRRTAPAGSATPGAALVWVLAQATGTDLTVDLRNGEPPAQVGLSIVVLFALQAAVAGWLLLAILERYTARPRLFWTTAAVLVLSFVPVLSVEATTSAKLHLALMHLIVGAVLIGGMHHGNKEA